MTAKTTYWIRMEKVTTDPSKVIRYRLPTEAGMEYAARGGNKSKGYKYSGSDTVGDVAWYSSNSESKPQEVGEEGAGTAQDL